MQEKISMHVLITITVDVSRGKEKFLIKQHFMNIINNNNINNKNQFYVKQYDSCLILSVM